jgi:hypothetical protein
MALATSGYAVYALARPEHLARALDAPPWQAAWLDALARTYGVRDLTTSALLLSSDPALARAACALRIAGDLGDCAVLTATATDPAVRRKVAAVTLGWAALNALAWWYDERA